MVVRDGRIGSVTVEDNQRVWELKKMIKDANPISIDAKDIELYPAKTEDGKWLTMEGNDVKMLKNGLLHETIKNIMQHGNAMDPTYPVGDAAFSVVPNDGAVGDIHVLVDLPAHRETEFVVNGVRYPVIHHRYSLHPVRHSIDLYPPELVAFWRALRTNHTAVEANAVVKLPEGIHLLGDPALGSQVYIRPCYPPLLTLCWEIIHDPKSPHLVILGNPGIGKKFFGFFILLQLARDNKTVVYECGLSKSRYLFAGDTVVKGSQDDFVDILDLPTTYYIVDAAQPPKCQAMTILLTKPKLKVWYSFAEDNCDIRYMPVWTWDEISTCHKLLYPDLELNVVTDCFRRWGGVPRYVLQYALRDTQQSLLERAIAIVNCNWVTNAIRMLDAYYCDEAYRLLQSHTSHVLLHYQVSDKFMKLHVDFASQYVQDEVYKRAWRDDPTTLVEFMTAASYTGSDEFAVLRGRMFESYVHSVLPRGGRFQIRRLEPSEGGSGEANADQDDKGGEDEEKADDGAVETKGDVAAQVMAHGTGAGLAAWDIHEDEGIVEVSPQRAVVFNTKAKVASAASGTYLRPAIKHDLPVDAIVKPDMLVTIAAKHLNKQMDLDDALDLLGNPVAPRLFFVLPPGEFDDFPYQRDLESKGNAKGVFKSVIQQFAMQVTPAVVQREMTQPSRDGPSKVAKRSRHE
ncbi:hypothetical protein DYB35_004758 [Aphanomyces astaci]|uniref:Crinkler effector protein N-terminal domain-containing protein n=4 Tax=Aphanomyces astaci TaxID=112090 RepID=A0A3R7A4B1_APHAT|nr:hypothetical protein DYB35_004758 [Aphanomyces astaci]